MNMNPDTDSRYRKNIGTRYRNSDTANIGRYDVIWKQELYCRMLSKKCFDIVLIPFIRDFRGSGEIVRVQTQIRRREELPLDCSAENEANSKSLSVSGFKSVSDSNQNEKQNIIVSEVNTKSPEEEFASSADPHVPKSPDIPSNAQPMKERKRLQELVKREWQKPEKSQIMTSLKRRYPFEQEASSSWDSAPKIDVVISKVARKSSLPFENLGSLKEPLDRKTDSCLKKAWEASAGALRPAIAATCVARSLKIWIDNLEDQIVHMWGRPSVDLFASKTNKKVQKFCSLNPAERSLAVEAFSLEWTSGLLYAFPPICLIPAVLKKIREDKARVIVILAENTMVLLAESDVSDGPMGTPRGPGPSNTGSLQPPTEFRAAFDSLAFERVFVTTKIIIINPEHIWYHRNFTHEENHITVLHVILSLTDCPPCNSLPHTVLHVILSLIDCPSCYSLPQTVLLVILSLIDCPPCYSLPRRLTFMLFSPSQTVLHVILTLTLSSMLSLSQTVLHAIEYGLIMDRRLIDACPLLIRLNVTLQSKGPGLPTDEEDPWAMHPPAPVSVGTAGAAVPEAAAGEPLLAASPLVWPNIHGPGPVTVGPAGT
ncbi:unnamed protein product, partial [Ranitomeya imitator]